MDRKYSFMKLEGSNFEIGKFIGNKCKDIPGIASLLYNNELLISEKDAKNMYKMFDDYCPGINCELEGFADAMGIEPIKVLYYTMTYLKPGCSQFVLMPSKTENGHTILARTYDFSDLQDELKLTLTKIKGKYAHISSSIMQFGRGDGINEQGLAVSQTSSGVPVGNFDFAAKPAIVGLQFWAVIRSVLENCKTVEDAVRFTKDMPIAFNINLMVADKNEAALIETYNGEKAIRRIDSGSEKQFLSSTNHIHMEELKKHSPKSMRNSVSRYELLEKELGQNNKISKAFIRKLLSTKYPEGLCCHYYDEFFGNLRSIIFDVEDISVDICFGSPALNDWYSFNFESKDDFGEYSFILEKENAAKDFYDMI